MMDDHERHYPKGSERVIVAEDGEAKCCKGRMWTTETKGQEGAVQVTRHADHAENCKLENPASANIPVNPITRKREKAKAK